MKEFFEEYGWSAITLVGGLLGIIISFHLMVGKDSQMAGVVGLFVDTLTKEPTEAVTFTLANDIDGNGIISKGDIIKIDEGLDMNGDGVEDTFKVMDKSGNEVVVIAMDKYKTSKFTDVVSLHEYATEPTAYIKGPRYLETTISDIADEYFNKMPEKIKKAVVKSIGLSQNMYQLKSGNVSGAELVGTYSSGGSTVTYSLIKEYSDEIGTKMVYIPDLSDFIRYYGGTVSEATLQSDFFGSTGKTSRRIWTRSTLYDTSGSMNNSIATIDSSTGKIGQGMTCSSALEVHPMFRLAIN